MKTRKWCARHSAVIKGYKYVIVVVSLFEVFDDGILRNLGQQHHIVHPGQLDILSLPMIHLLQQKQF
jgi:hypothetical protein